MPERHALCQFRGPVILLGRHADPLVVDREEQLPQRAGQDVAQDVRLAAVDELVPRGRVQGGLVRELAQRFRLLAGVSGLPELLRDVREGRGLRQVALGSQELGGAEPSGAEGDEGGGDIGQPLVHREALGSQRVVQVRSQPIEHGVAGLVCDDVARQAEVDVAAVGLEGEELEAPRLSLVERIRRPARPGQDQQLRTVEAPGDRASEDFLVLVQPDRAHGDAERILGEELAGGDDVGPVRQRIAVQRAAAGRRDERHGRQGCPGLLIEVDDRESPGDRAVREERFLDVVVLGQLLERAALRPILDQDRHPTLCQHRSPPSLPRPANHGPVGTPRLSGNSNAHGTRPLPRPFADHPVADA